MSQPAAELWLDELADAAEVDGEVIHSAVTIDLDIASIVTIHRHHASEERPQGIAVDADAAFTVAGESTTSAVLWSDTAPEVVEFHVQAGRLSLWNVWRDGGTVHAWMGAAGIRRVELDDHDSDFGLRLLASDGHGGSDTDLVVEVRIDADQTV